MSHEHKHADHRHAGRQHQPPQGGGLHKDWRTWVVIGLMLLGMVAYVLTFNEEEQPGGGEQPAVPAAAE